MARRRERRLLMEGIDSTVAYWESQFRSKVERDLDKMVNNYRNNLVAFINNGEKVDMAVRKLGTWYESLLNGIPRLAEAMGKARARYFVVMTRPATVKAKE